MASSTVVYDPKTCSFTCLHCLEVVEVRRKILNDQEQLLMFAEALRMDHSECANYSDIAKAVQARQFRKEHKRQQIHQRHGYGRSAGL